MCTNVMDQSNLLYIYETRRKNQSIKTGIKMKEKPYLISRMDEPMAKDGLWRGERNKSQWKYEGSFMAQT